MSDVRAGPGEGAIPPGRVGRGGTPRAVRPLALALGLVTVAWLFPGLGRVGLTWDEPIYFQSVIRIQEWTAELIRGSERGVTLSAERISEVWDADHYWNPHPPVYKEAMALTGWLTSRWLDPVRGFRLASVLWFALLVGGVVWATGRRWSIAAGIGAGLSLLLFPRAFGHAHFAATDTPLTLFWFAGAVGLALYLLEGRRGGLLLGGLGLGLGMGTKFTGWLLPLPMLVWVVLFERTRRGAVAFAIWLGLGTLVFWLFNPMAWHDPVTYVGRLFAESLGREEIVPISTYYFGTQYGHRVPWHHAVVMTLITLPLPILVLFVTGGVGALRRLWREPFGTLAVGMVLFFWVLMAEPTSPNHDGIRLFLPMFPFAAVLAGRGFATLVDVAGSRLAGRAPQLAALTLGGLFFYPPYLQITRIAPLYLSYYNEAIGGLRGAAEAGMEVTYWYDSVTPDFLRRVNAYLPEGATVSGFPTSGYLYALQAYGLLRSDLVLTAEWPSPFYLLVARKSAFGPVQWAVYRNVEPVVAVAVDGVVLAGLYRWSGEPEDTAGAAAAAGADDPGRMR